MPKPVAMSPTTTPRRVMQHCSFDSYSFITSSAATFAYSVSNQLALYVYDNNDNVVIFHLDNQPYIEDSQALSRILMQHLSCDDNLEIRQTGRNFFRIYPPHSRAAQEPHEPQDTTLISATPKTPEHTPEYKIETPAPAIITPVASPDTTVRPMPGFCICENAEE